MGLAVACLAYATFGLVVRIGLGHEQSLFLPACAVLAVPVFLAAWRRARRGDPVASAAAGGAGLLALVLAAAWSAGEPSPLWFVAPLLALLLGLAIGVWAGSVPRHAAPAPEGDDRVLRSAMRVESVVDLSSMVAHQLRNRLQVMSGHAALAAGEDAEHKDERFATIRAEIDAALHMLDQLLYLVHPDAGVVQKVDLVGLCAALRPSLRAILPSAIELEVVLPEEPIPVELEPSGLRDALLNLVLNARHAIGDRGRLTLALSRREGAASIEVIDTGRGIAAGDLARVFEPYFTTKPRGQGTGLGLVAVQRFVEASAGEVEVDSTLGRGTTFRLQFPLAG